MKFGTIKILLFLSLCTGLSSLQAKEYLTKHFMVNKVEFRVHYTKDYRAFAAYTVAKIKNSVPKLHKFFGFKPIGPIHFYIDESAGSANGEARVFPYNKIILNPYPPLSPESLALEHADWIESLIVHEYTHILNMDLTLGVQDLLRSIIGSSAKWGSIAPTWFIEGIAVYTESKFSQPGRLDSPQLVHYLYHYFEQGPKTDFPLCFEVHCLDNPGFFPFGHIPYWVGGFFVEYLEEIRPGTLRCIIKENAESVPLTFPRHFKRCTGMFFKPAFSQFKKAFLSSKKNLVEQDLLLNELVTKHLKQDYLLIDFEKGVLERGNFYYFTYGEDWKRKTRGRVGTNTLIQLNKVTGQKKKIYFHTGMEKIYFYDQSHLQVDFSGVNDLLSDDPKKNRISYRVKLPDFKIVDEKKRTALELWDFQKYTLSYNNMDYRLLNKSNQQSLYYESISTLTNPKQTKTGDLTFDYKGEKTSFFEQNNFAKKENFVEKRESKKLTEANSDKEEKYSLWDHFYPNFLYLNYSLIFNLETLFLQTSLEDPLQKHYLGVDIATYLEPTPQPVAGSFAYSYNYLDPLIYSVFYSSWLAKNLFFNEIFQNEYYGVGVTRKNLIFKDYDLSARYFHKYLNELFLATDFQDVLKVALSDTKDYGSYLNLFQGYSWRLGMLGNKPRGFKEYYGHEAEVETYWRLHSEIGFNLNLQHYQLYKDDFRRGTLQGGGVNSFLTGEYTFDFYPLDFQSFIGNELFKFEVKINHLAWSIYDGPENFPLFFKEGYLVYGVQTMKSDFIFTNNDIYRDKTLTAFFIGPSFNLTAGYLLDAKIQLIYSDVISPIDDKLSSLQLLFQANVF
ncbi:hypothetical protein N9N67_01770 [Bacteriovoracaceae bacterium]|nr:hypothetical protein [Bacteriovoracaceae bacterium]